MIHKNWDRTEKNQVRQLIMETPFKKGVMLLTPQLLDVKLGIGLGAIKHTTEIYSAERSKELYLQTMKSAEGLPVILHHSHGELHTIPFPSGVDFLFLDYQGNMRLPDLIALEQWSPKLKPGANLFITASAITKGNVLWNALVYPLRSERTTSLIASKIEQKAMHTQDEYMKFREKTSAAVLEMAATVLTTLRHVLDTWSFDFDVIPYRDGQPMLLIALFNLKLSPKRPRLALIDETIRQLISL